MLTRRPLGLLVTAIAIFLVVFPPPVTAVHGQPPAAWPPTHSDGGWLALMCAAAAGLGGTSLFFSSLVRSKNTLATVGQVWISVCCAALTWVVLSAILYGDGITGRTGAFPSVTNPTSLNRASGYLAFGLVVATSALLVGGAVERLRLIAVALLSVAWTVLVFSPLTQFSWSPISQESAYGFSDWGGASAHLAAGCFAFGLSIAAGNRHGYGRIPMPPYHMGLALVGGMVMVVGLSGFNEFGASPRIGVSFSGTFSSIVAALTGVIVWALIENVMRGVASSLGMISGAISAVVAVTALAGWATPVTAILVGALGSAIAFVGAVVLRRLHNYDDTLDIFSIHALPAVAGLLIAPLVSDTLRDSVTAQFIGVIGIAAIAFLVAFTLGVGLKKLGWLRVSFDDEDAGLDISHFGETVHPPQPTL